MRRRRDGRDVPPSQAVWVILHNDRFTPQYSSAPITVCAAEYAIVHSMQLTGVCGDKAMATSCFASLGIEFYYRRVWPAAGCN